MTNGNLYYIINVIMALLLDGLRPFKGLSRCALSFPFLISISFSYSPQGCGQQRPLHSPSATSADKPVDILLATGLAAVCVKFEIQFAA